MSKILRFAMAGAGFWAQKQLAAWHEIPGAKCVGVCDPDREKADRLATTFGVPSFTDAETMLDTIRPDFFDIVSSVASHSQLVRLAASRRLPVICQKPLVENWQECIELADLCRAAGVPLLVHENWRWQTPLRQARDLLHAGAIGRPFRARIDFISGFDVFANQPALRTHRRFILADMGCHLLDLARSWFGEFATVYCVTSRVGANIAGEDVATVVLRSNTGDLAVQTQMAFALTPLENDVFPQTLTFVEGDAGSLEIKPDYSVCVTTQAGTRVYHAPPQNYGWADDPKYAVAQTSMVECMRNLLTDLAGGPTAETRVEDNLKTMELVFAAYESAESNAVVSVGQRRF